MQMLVEKYKRKFEQVIINVTKLKSGIKMIINGRDVGSMASFQHLYQL